MLHQASYVVNDQGSTYAVVFEGDTIIAAIEAPDPNPELLLDYVHEIDTVDSLLVEQLNQGLSFGGVAEIEHLGYVG